MHGPDRRSFARLNYLNAGFWNFIGFQKWTVLWCTHLLMLKSKFCGSTMFYSILNKIEIKMWPMVEKKKLTWSGVSTALGQKQIILTPCCAYSKVFPADLVYAIIPDLLAQYVGKVKCLCNPQMLLMFMTTPPVLVEHGPPYPFLPMYFKASLHPRIDPIKLICNWDSQLVSPLIPALLIRTSTFPKNSIHFSKAASKFWWELTSTRK